jgi:hypothetical protein
MTTRANRPCSKARPVLLSPPPPLLSHTLNCAELGINFSHIAKKVTAVLMLQRDIGESRGPSECDYSVMTTFTPPPADPSLMTDSDMAGPLVFCLALGFCLLLTGKVHFGYIYGFGALGCCAMYVVVNLMAHSASLDFSHTFSIMGYCLLPIVMLSALAVFVDMKGAAGMVVAGGAILWCTLSSARFFDAAMSMREQKWLLAYPAFLLYAAFALITIF